MLLLFFQSPSAAPPPPTPTEICNSNTVAALASCFFCTPSGYWRLYELALLCKISQGGQSSTCGPSSLDISCFLSCLAPGQYYPVKLALLMRWLELVGGTAPTVAELVDEAKCFECNLLAGMVEPVAIAAACRISQA